METRSKIFKNINGGSVMEGGIAQSIMSPDKKISKTQGHWAKRTEETKIKKIQ